MKRFETFLKEIKADNLVKMVGYVSDKDLAMLYKASQGYIFPSLSEGFGLPGLEAMAYSTPVIVSDIPVLKEIYGDAALYFNPRSEIDIAAKIRQEIVNANCFGNSDARRCFFESIAKIFQPPGWRCLW